MRHLPFYHVSLIFTVNCERVQAEALVSNMYTLSCSPIVPQAYSYPSLLHTPAYIEAHASLLCFTRWVKSQAASYWKPRQRTWENGGGEEINQFEQSPCHANRATKHLAQLPGWRALKNKRSRSLLLGKAIDGCGAGHQKPPVKI